MEHMITSHECVNTVCGHVDKQLQRLWARLGAHLVNSLRVTLRGVVVSFRRALGGCFLGHFGAACAKRSRSAALVSTPSFSNCRATSASARPANGSSPSSSSFVFNRWASCLGSGSGSRGACTCGSGGRCLARVLCNCRHTGRRLRVLATVVVVGVFLFLVVFIVVALRAAARRSLPSPHRLHGRCACATGAGCGGALLDERAEGKRAWVAGKYAQQALAGVPRGLHVVRLQRREELHVELHISELRLVRSCGCRCGTTTGTTLRAHVGRREIDERLQGETTTRDCYWSSIRGFFFPTVSAASTVSVTSEDVEEPVVVLQNVVPRASL
jgi:hypothetical protein